MGIRVAYGAREDISAAIQKGTIPKDCIIIGTYGEQDDAELFFYDAATNLKHMVAQTKFNNTTTAIQYAVSHAETGQIVAVLDGAAYRAYLVQPDYTLKEVGFGSFDTGNIEQMVADIADLKEQAHTHTNKAVLDSITEERVQKWDNGNVDLDSLPIATGETKGVVVGSDKENGVSVAEDGTMVVNSVSIDKITQGTDSEIIFDCGSAAE